MAQYLDFSVSPKVPVLFVAFNGSAPVYLEVEDYVNGQHRTTYTFDNSGGGSWSALQAYNFPWTGMNHRRMLRLRAWTNGSPIDVDRRGPGAATIGRRDISGWPGTGVAPNPWHATFGLEMVDG